MAEKVRSIRSAGSVYVRCAYDKCQNWIRCDSEIDWCDMHGPKVIDLSPGKFDTVLNENKEKRCFYYYPESRGRCMAQIPSDRSYCLEHLAILGHDKPETLLPVDPDIDTAHIQRLEHLTKGIRLRLKEYNVAALENVHFRLVCRGTRDAIDLFHHIVHKLDQDYPLRPYYVKGANPTVSCDKCKGTVWPKCRFTPDELKRLAKQCGMYIKVHSYKDEAKCKLAKEASA